MPAEASTKPKGATTYKQTAFGVISRSKLLKLEVEGTKKGLEFIHELFTKNTIVEVTPDLIKKLHLLSFGWIFPDWAGRYRTVQVMFSGKEALPYYKIPELITNLCRDLHTRLEQINSETENYLEQVVELLAWFQHQFVLIHPFVDYNGRIARMFTAIILLNLGLPPFEIKASTGQDRKRYLEAMYVGDRGDLSKLEHIISNALTESLQSVNRK